VFLGVLDKLSAGPVPLWHKSPDSASRRKQDSDLRVNRDSALVHLHHAARLAASLLHGAA